MRTIAILGYPGAGKSWAVYNFAKEFIDGYGVEFNDPAAVRKRIGLVDYHDFGKVVVVGIYDGTTFQGTDRLSMAVAPDFEKFYDVMNLTKKEFIIAEGDRINNMTFFKTALKYGHLERIKCDPGSYQKLLEQRRARNHEFPAKFLLSVASKVDKHNFDKTFTSSGLLDYLKTATNGREKTVNGGAN